MHFLILKMLITWLILTLSLGHSRSQSVLKYRVKEEVEAGFVLGNINNYVMTTMNEYQSYEATVIHNYFEILPNKDLVIKKRIDLEVLCSEASKCCTGNQCIMTINVLVSGASLQNQPFNIEVEVLDINDNKPTFKNAMQSLSIQEDSDLNSQIQFEGASDIDFSQNNQIRSYYFKEPTMTFVLDNDISSLMLILKKPIDFEQQNVYKGNLSACDSAIRCVNQPIVINIQDINDNYPKFIKSRYEIKILESFEIGKVVIAARAIDLDGEQFNKTKYGFHNNRDTFIESKFRINSSNGDVILKSKLTAKQRETFSFKIFAIDTGKTVLTKKDIADVSIHVIDINDNKPLISVHKSNRITIDKESFEIRILESEGPQKLMTIVVTDEDLGLNGKVDCQLRDHSLSLQLKDYNLNYEISSIRFFDYEQETQIIARFECKDRGTPSLMSVKSIIINVEDVNEYKPAFDQSIFHGSVLENRGPGEVVLTVRATDKDGAAVLTYSLEEEATRYFAIHPKTGVIKTASVPFDRELLDRKSFRVTVTDSVVNAQSAEARVEISILDENDNDPIFVPSSLQFNITENKPDQTKVQGHITANDADKDDSNSFIIFKWIDTYDSMLRKCERPYFKVRANGEVETLTSIDREVNANFTLTIEARDKGNPSRYSLANATVIVLDVNDNRPQWIYPRIAEFRRNGLNTLPMLNLTENTERFLLIMQLKAVDPDQNEAGRVSYLLMNSHHSLFSLNETTGELRTEKSPLPYGQYQLQLRAVDHGNPALTSESWIMINVYDSGKLSNINLTIIIGMVAVTALISVFLIVAIICVRRRPRFQQSYLGSVADNNGKDQHNQYFTHNQWMYQPNEDGIMPPLSDTESCVYMSSNFYEQQDPLILHTLAGSRPASRIDYPLIFPSVHQVNNVEQKFGLDSTQNAERTNGTLRSNSGLYYGLDAASSGIVINGQELDGDSADSGKGASEVDLRLQYQLNNASRNYPTMPFPHHSPATSIFGYSGNMSEPQFYSSGTNPKSCDSRFLTVHPVGPVIGKRRVNAMSPKFNSSTKPCQCFMLPEDDVIQVGHDSAMVPMTTFSHHHLHGPSLSKSTNHNLDHNCVYRDEGVAQAGMGYYSHCPYIPSGLSQSPGPLSTNEIADDVMEPTDQSYNDMFQSSNMSSFGSNGDPQMVQDNIYTMGMTN